MGLTWVILPGGKNRKYQGKISKLQYKEMKRERKLNRQADREIQQQLRQQRVDRALSGDGNHDIPWWREPTLASLIGRKKGKHHE